MGLNFPAHYSDACYHNQHHSHDYYNHVTHPLNQSTAINITQLKNKWLLSSFPCNSHFLHILFVLFLLLLLMFANIFLWISISVISASCPHALSDQFETECFRETKTCNLPYSHRNAWLEEKKSKMWFQDDGETTVGVLYSFVLWQLQKNSYGFEERQIKVFTIYL